LKAQHNEHEAPHARSLNSSRANLSVPVAFEAQPRAVAQYANQGPIFSWCPLQRSRFNTVQPLFF
jgi:hypothetical protein